jgi:hypothetical protein
LCRVMSHLLEGYTVPLVIVADVTPTVASRSAILSFPDSDGCQPPQDCESGDRKPDLVSDTIQALSL